MRPRPAEWQLALPLALAYAAFFLVPLALLILVSAFDDERITTIGFAQWRSFLGDPFTWKVIFDTVKLGVVTVVATAVIGYPIALVFLGAGPRWQRVILFVVILPLLTSVVVRTFAWIVILGREGVVNQAVLWLGLAPAPLNLLQTEPGLVIALTQIEMPLLLLPLLSVMSRMDPNLRDASAGLGASRWRTLLRV
ncbi:MAG: ABC transporter permease, partial [Candidatus Rokuibacteriota bacterium]